MKIKGEVFDMIEQLLAEYKIQNYFEEYDGEYSPIRKMDSCSFTVSDPKNIVNEKWDCFLEELV